MKLREGLHESIDKVIHVDPRYRWYPTKEGGGKLVPRPKMKPEPARSGKPN